MSTPRQKTTWQRTSVQNLLRNRQSGHYYGRFTISGKQNWCACAHETDVLSVAKLRPADICVLQGLLALARKTPGEQIDRASAKALQRAGWRLGDLKQALAEPANVVPVDFLETHPLIRDLQGRAQRDSP